MKNSSYDRIVYSISVGDIQEVAKQVLKRNLTKREVILVEESIGEYIDWFQAIENALPKHVAQ